MENIEKAIKEFAESSVTEERSGEHWDRCPIAELVQHILDNYHAPVRKNLVKLVDLSASVERENSQRSSGPRGLTNLLIDIQAALLSHLTKEELILFPIIRAGRGQTAHMPIQVMIQEHADHTSGLSRIRELTRDFEIPEYADPNWRELYDALRDFERELEDHIHLENDILFPRILAS